MKTASPFLTVESTTRLRIRIVAALILSGCTHGNNSGTRSQEIDPYAPAVPELASSDNGREGDSKVGSEDPVVVDSMTSAGVTPSQATQDYIDAFNDQPGYNPANKDADVAAKKVSGYSGQDSRKMVVNISRINLRSEPNRFSKIVGELRKGDVIAVEIDEKIGWAIIQEGEHQGKHIRARHLKSAKE